MAGSARARFERLDDKWWLAFVLDSQAVSPWRAATPRCGSRCRRPLALAVLTGNAKASVDALLTLARARTALATRTVLSRPRAAASGPE